MTLSYFDVATSLPLGAFMKLQDDLASPETAKYVRRITGVAKVNRSKNPDRPAYIGSVKYEPQEGGRFPDSGEIPTGWLNDPVATLICEIAKEHVGQNCLIYQRNRDKSDDQPSGFREICWIEPLDQPTGRKEPAAEVRREPDPPRQQPAERSEPQPNHSWQPDEGPRHSEEPF